LNAAAIASLSLAVTLLGVPPPAVTALPSAAPAATSAARAALATVLANDREFGDTCTPAQQRTIVGAALFRTLGRLDGDDVVLATIYNPCICGAQNCPYYVLRVAPGRPRELLATMGITLGTQPASPLPRLVVRMHDNAATAAETTYAYRDGAYAVVQSLRYRWSDKAHKPNSIPVHFAAYASSALLRGSVSLSWYDTYEFAANGRQQLVIDAVVSKAPLRLTLSGPGNTYVTLTAGKPYALPASGTYHVQVDNDAEQDTPYALRLAIR
jgi:hypothetical protein